MTDTVPGAEDWVTVAEAARRLGVTPTAVRGRIERGTLDTKPNGNRGRLVRVTNPEGQGVGKGEGKGSEKGCRNPEGHGDDRVSIPVAELQRLTASAAERDLLQGMLAELRADRDSWRGVAERLSERAPTPRITPRSSWRRWLWPA